MCATCGCSTDQPHEPHHHGHGHGHGHGHHDHDHDHHHDHVHHHVPTRTIQLERDLLAKNAKIAARNRISVDASRIAIFNLIGSPGAGKTALLEAAIRRLLPFVPVAVLEGDQATDNDARRIERAGCPVLQINTGTGCHLDASMIAGGLRTLAPRRESIVLVENVGNLVCPALFDLGERAKIVVMSVTEGEDKPLKYPHVFRASELLVLTKTDLQPLVGLDVAQCIAHARAVNPRIRVLSVSAKTGEGIDAFCTFVREEAARGCPVPASDVIQP